MNTHSRFLRGQCYYKKGQWHWHVKDAEGKRIAYGEEKHLKHAHQNAHDVVFAVQTWTMFGRYKLYNPTGRLFFATESVRNSRNPNYF